MCKYCKVEHDGFSDLYTGCNNVLMIRDGNLGVRVDILHNKHKDYHNAKLCLDYGKHGADPISEAEIAIKYCPFCGEEL